MGISETEYRRRYAAIRERMVRDGLDSLLVLGLPDDFNRGNIRYLTGSGRGGCCIFPLEGPPVFLINPIHSHSPKLPKIMDAFELLDLRETNNPIEQAVKELSRFDNGNKIGLIGMASISVPMFLALKEKFGDRFIDQSDYLRPLREIKSSEELENLRTAAAIADRVYARLREIIRPGLRDSAIYGEVKKIIYGEGCEYSFDLLDADGSKMNMTFSPSGETLEENGTLFMEISPAYQGYYAQLPVTLPVGQYQPHVREMVKAWNNADQAVRKVLRPGIKVSEVCNFLVDSIREQGFVSPLRPGHSIGLDILDCWDFNAENHTPLKAGMTVAIHPACMSKMGGDGIGMGYTYLITESGAEQLSQVDLAKDLLAE